MTVDFDDTEDHWAGEYIGRLAARGILSGVGDNLFRPDEDLTRAQFLTMLANTPDGIRVTGETKMPFTDVPDYEWFYRNVMWGFENGIVSGIGDGTFAPNAGITREQMTVMLSNFTRYLGFEIPQTVTDVSFTDRALISDWAEAFVMTVAGGGIMGGHPDGRFDPQGNATRAQAARVVFVLNAMTEAAVRINDADSRHPDITIPEHYSDDAYYDDGYSEEGYLNYRYGEDEYEREWQ